MAQKASSASNLAAASKTANVYKVLNATHEFLDPKYHKYTEASKKGVVPGLSPEQFKTAVSNYKSFISEKGGDLSVKQKVKLIFMIRHGQGWHNYAKHSIHTPKSWIEEGYHLLPKYKDPALTDLGVQQAKSLYKNFEAISDDIQLVVMSPLKRAIQTATYAVLPSLQKNSSNSSNLPSSQNLQKSDKSPNVTNNTNNSGSDASESKTDVTDSANGGKREYVCDTVVAEFARERINNHSCDSRSSLKEIQAVWKDYDFKYTGFVMDSERGTGKKDVDDTDDSTDMLWDPEQGETFTDLEKRGKRFLDYLLDERDENIIVYAGHCDIIVALLKVFNILEREGHRWKPKYAAGIPIVLTKEAVAAKMSK